MVWTKYHLDYIVKKLQQNFGIQFYSTIQFSESNSNLHHNWDSLQHLCRGRVLRYTLETCVVVNTMADILWRWNSGSHCNTSMVHNWLLGGRKGLWNNISRSWFRHHDYLDFGVDCGSWSIWKTKSIDRTESIGFSEALIGCKHWFHHLKMIIKIITVFKGPKNSNFSSL